MSRNLSVPESSESSIVRNTNITGLKEAPAAAIFIDNSGAPPGAATGRNTYEPSQLKVRLIAEARGEVPKRVEVIDVDSVQKIHGVDYLSAVDTKKKLKIKDSEILSLAKQIWGQESDARKRYRRAKKMVQEASEDELENLDVYPRLARAMKVLEKGAMTKKKAKKKAQIQLDRRSRGDG